VLEKTRATTQTRSSAIAEGPRDASCQLKSCQLPRNSAETTCTSPEQIEVMKLEGYRDIAGYLSKVADFDPPHLHLAPPQGLIPVEFRGDLWHQKTRIPGLSWGCCLCDPTFSPFSRTPTCDGRTDRRTQGHNIYCGCIASRGKNVKSHVFWILKKNVKSVKKRTYSFRGHLITPVFNTQLPKVSTCKSPASNILFGNADVVFTFTRNYAT